MAGTTVLNRSITLEGQINQTTTTTVIKDVGSTHLVTEIGGSSPVSVGGTTFGVGRGKSVYDLAVENGFTGTEQEYLDSIIGPSAYQVALDSGFVGTELEWIESLKGDSAYEVALNNGFVGTEDEWIESLKLQIATTEQDAGKILTNDGTDTMWLSLSEKLNSDEIQWDLGEI